MLVVECFGECVCVLCVLMSHCVCVFVCIVVSECVNLCVFVSAFVFCIFL